MKWAFGTTITKPFLWFSLRFFLYSYSVWIQLTSIALEVVIGTRVSLSYVDRCGAGNSRKTRVTGKKGSSSLNIGELIQPPQKGKVKIMIMNHHSRVDWVYLQLLISRTNFRHKFYVVLKEDLKRIPFFGPCIQMQASMLLSRSWAVDKPYLSRLVKAIKGLEDSFVVQIYPEGTDLSKSSVTKSQEFAKNHGLPQFMHVLNPRTVGAVALKEMFGEDRIESVIDATVGYTYGASRERPSELNLVNENHAKKVHYLLQEFPMEGGTESREERTMECCEKLSVPRNSEAFAKWIQHQFELKEQLLSRFYHTSPVGFDEADVKEVLGESIDFLSNDHEENIENEKSLWEVYIGDFGWMRGIVLPFCFFIVLPLLVFVIQCYVAGLPGVIVVLMNTMSLVSLEVLSRTIDLQKLVFLSSVEENEIKEESGSASASTSLKVKSD